jgi:transcriptional regulator with XRE-family HTH domain
MPKTAALDPIEMEIGTRVRRRRRTIEMPQQQLADAIGVSQQQMQKYELGTNRIAVSTMIRIASVLRTSVAALVGEDDAALEELD